MLRSLQCGQGSPRAPPVGKAFLNLDVCGFRGNFLCTLRHLIHRNQHGFRGLVHDGEPSRQVQGPRPLTQAYFSGFAQNPVS